MSCHVNALKCLADDGYFKPKHIAALRSYNKTN